MIKFDYLEVNKDKLRLEYLTAKPFPFLIIDGFCDEDKLRKLVSLIPEIKNKSRDYIFANNKFEKSKIEDISPDFFELRNDLLSARFKDILRYICGDDVIVDPDFHGGGIHQGRENSYLDMHIDFNYHPIKKNWYRNLNLLLYLNDGWREEWGGHLKLEDLRSGEKHKIGVPFNRMVIQQTRAYTLHGYDKISFPPGRFRTSIAAYAYSIHQRIIETPRLTDWYIDEKKHPWKKIAGNVLMRLVSIKSKIFGSATARNK